MASIKSSFRAVLFDLDGTLIEFKFDVKASRKAMIQVLESKGFDIANLSQEMRTQAILNESRRQLLHSARLRGLYTEAEIEAELSQVLDQFELEAFRAAKPHPGSLQVLRYVTKNRILAALVTNSGRVPVDSLLDTFGFGPYLTLIVTRNEVQRLKPDPEGILKALQLLSVAREDALYVGDSVIDIEAARAAKVKSVAVASGLYQAEQLLPHAPDFLIHKIEELEQIVLPTSTLH